jgi:hypothetical protein
MNSIETLREEWKKHVEDWKASGKSCQRWAKENNLSYHSLLYWRQKYAKKEPVSSPSQFVELSDRCSPTPQSGIALEMAGVILRIDRSFDPLTLISCIQLLKKL